MFYMNPNPLLGPHHIDIDTAMLPGDFRANLTPIQIAPCGSKDGQGFDIITDGKHIDQANSILVVSTLTQACFNFDPRRAAGNQANLFSCGGRADGSESTPGALALSPGLIVELIKRPNMFSALGGQATTSQQFAFTGGANSLSLEPRNAKGTCFAAKGNVVDVAGCKAGDAGQTFTIGSAAGGGGGEGGNNNNNNNNGGSASGTGRNNGTPATGGASSSTTSAAGRAAVSSAAITATAAPAKATGGGNGNGNGGNQPPAAGNPTAAVPVSRAGGTLQPSAAAEAHQRDNTASRSFTGVRVRAPNGQCLSVDPTAGDFRQNLIPVAMAACSSGSENQRFDVIVGGRHNDGRAGGALLVSSLTNGCVSIDGRRQADDTVTLFSCGGRADGGGDTNAGQLFPIANLAATGADQSGFQLAPLSDDGKLCVVPGDKGRLVTGPCVGGQLYTILQ